MNVSVCLTVGCDGSPTGRNIGFGKACCARFEWNGCIGRCYKCGLDKLLEHDPAVSLLRLRLFTAMPGSGCTLN